MNNDDFCDLLSADLPGWKAVTNVKIVDQSRWSVYYEQIFKEVETNKLYKAYWGAGATEYQDGQEEYWSLVEVEPKEVIKTIYKKVENGTKFEGTI